MRFSLIKACVLLALTITMNLDFSHSERADGIYMSIWNTASAQKTKKAASKALTVRYSYQKQTQGKRSQHVLIPVIEKMNPDSYDVFAQRQRVLFNAVKSEKSASYGATKFAVKDRVVFVFIDAKKIKNSSFIMAETIYTFTENGADAVRFPKSKFSGRDYTRRDVSFPAYQLTLPYWEGLPPQKTNAILNLGDGNFLTSSTLNAQLKRDDTTLISQLITTLKAGKLAAVSAIVDANRARQIKGLEEGFVALLQSANAQIRLTAIEGLVGREKREVYEALKAVVNDDPDMKVRDAAARELARAKNPKFSVVATFHLLRSSQTAVALSAVKTLSAIKRNKEVNPELIKTLKHPEESVRTAVLDALMRRKAIKELGAQLEGELKIEAKVQIAERLITNKKSKAAAFNFLVTQPNAEAAIRALELLRGKKIGKDESVWFKKALRHPDMSVRVKVAELLGESTDKKVLKVLADGDIEDAESGELLHAAMRAVYARQRDKVILNDAARETKVSLKSAATGTLGLLYNKTKAKRNLKRILKAIGQLMQSSKEWVRAEAVRSLGDLKTPEALVDILKLRDDQAPRVRWAVARVLKLFAEAEARPHLIHYLNAEDRNKDVRLMRTAIKSLDHLKSVEAFKVIFTDTFLKHSDASVRRAALNAVVTLVALIPVDKRAQYTTKIYLVLDADADTATRISAVRALGLISDQNSRDFLSGAAGAQDVNLAKAVIDALIAHKTDAGVKMLENSADHKSSDVRAYLYTRLSEFKQSKRSKAARSILNYSLKRESNDKLKLKIANTLKAF